MEPTGELVVVRLGHRPGRDDRMTTHVGLTGRALGADRFVLIGDHDAPLERIDDVTRRFGGPYETERRDTFGQFVRGWTGDLLHLTMYGIPIQKRVDEVRAARDDLAIIVGAGKVSFDIYEAADWNVAVTNQPHSEVAGLAVLLDRLFEGRSVEREWANASRRVIPQERGKRVESVEHRSGDEES